jgi:hypothetical protein
MYVECVGTFAAELIHLIENTRVVGGGKPVVVEKKTDKPTSAPATITDTAATGSSKIASRKPFENAAAGGGGTKVMEDDDDMNSMKSTASEDFDEEQYFKLIAALPGLTDQLGEKECWEMKRPGGEKINVMFGGGTQSTQEAAKLIAKAKKHVGV